MGKAYFGIRVQDEGGAPVRAGSRLQGAIVATIEEEIRGTELLLQFVGQEKTRVKYTTTTSSGNSTTTVTRYANASRNLFSVSLPVSDQNVNMIQYGGRIVPGSYEVPFEFELPESLPSTMMQEQNGGYCMISYEMKAELKGSGVLWNYKCDREVRVEANPLETVAIPYSAPPVTEKVNFFCCINRGSMIFGAKVNDTRLDRGESTTVCFSCCNNTTVMVERIDACLMQECRWSASGHSEQSYNMLQRIDFPNFESASARQLLAPRQSLNREDSARQERDLVFREVESGKHTGRVTMPEAALNSYAGSLMTVQHHILVQVHTGCCVDSPTIRIPVQSGEARTSAAPLPPAQVVPTTITIAVPSSVGVLGGKATSWEGDEEPEVVFAPTPSQQSPSLALLLEQMDESVMDMDIIQSKINDQTWNLVFEVLAPADFGAIIQKVNSDFDQPKVAVAVAGAMPQFSCAHVVAALRTTSEWNRSAVTEQLLPYSRDLVQNQQIILAELSDWEKLTTERAFANALKVAAS